MNLGARTPFRGVCLKSARNGTDTKTVVHETADIRIVLFSLQVGLDVNGRVCWKGMGIIFRNLAHLLSYEEIIPYSMKICKRKVNINIWKIMVPDVLVVSPPNVTLIAFPPIALPDR